MGIWGIFHCHVSLPEGKLALIFEAPTRIDMVNFDFACKNVSQEHMPTFLTQEK